MDLHPDWTRALDEPMSGELALSLVELLHDPDERALLVATYAHDPHVALLIIGEAGRKVAYLDAGRTTEPMAVFAYLAYLADLPDLAMDTAAAVLAHYPRHPVAATAWTAALRGQDAQEQKDYLASQIPMLEKVVQLKRIVS